MRKFVMFYFTLLIYYKQTDSFRSQRYVLLILQLPTTNNKFKVYFKKSLIATVIYSAYVLF